MLEAFLIALAALPVTAFTTWWILRRQPTRAVAVPQEERWHREPTPTLGGVGIFAGMAVGYGLLIAIGTLEFDKQIAGLLAGGTIVFASGLVDDLRPLPAWAKLAGQLAAVAVVMATGTVIEIVAADWIAYPLTVLWLIGITNAFNLLDNMDGLSSLIAIVSAGLFAASSVLQDSVAIAALAAVIAYACLGFLPFNLRRGRAASIFMGDSGSQLLGFMLASIALLSNWRGSSNVIVALIVPLLLLAVPILDTALVTLVRLRERRPVYLGGRDHSSHRLVGHGLSEQRAVLVLTALAAILGGLTLALVELDRPFLTVAGVCLAAALLIRFGLFLAGLQRADRPARPPLVNSRFFVIHRRQAVEVVIDALIITAAYALAYALRFQDFEEEAVWRGGIFWDSLWLLLVVRLVAFGAFGLYRGIWRHAGVRDLISIGYAVLASAIVTVAILTMSGRFEGHSRSVFVIDVVICIGLISASRLSERWIEDLLSSVRGASGSRRVLIVGAGKAGISLLREFQETPGHSVLGFVDDDPEKQGMRVQRVPILGTCWNCGEAIDRVRADLVLVTIPRAPRETLSHIVSVCDDRGVTCRFALREHDLDPAQFLETTETAGQS